ncbi:MAG: hypothetical protein L0226_16260 [Acidobacteria bacterium]|nr:hypothetical protein [Acidobacteriota bacterium]
MSKLGLPLALFVILILGVVMIGASSKAANNDNEGKNVAPPAVKLDSDVSVLSLSPVNNSLDMPEPSIFNPFPAFQNPLFANMAGVTTTTQTATEENAALAPINTSGIRALVSVKIIAGTNTVTGFATGMDPYKAYVSLFYDAGSPGSGPCACIPSNPPPPSLQATCRTTNKPKVTFSQMVIGYWLPLIGTTTRSMLVLKASPDPNAPVPLAAVPLANIGAVSVREDTKLGTPLPAAPDPARFQLRACGRLRPDF